MPNHLRTKHSSLRIGVQSVRAWITLGQPAPDAPVNALKLQLPVGAITKAKEYVIYATNLTVIVITERIATLTMCVAYVLVPICNLIAGTKRKENNHKTSYKLVFAKDTN